MGGIGSGQYLRWNNATKLEELQRLEVKALKKMGFLDSGLRIGTVSWNRGGEPTGSINIHSDGRQLTATWRSRYHFNNDWISQKQVINLRCTPCNYGGYRKWLECPYCLRRVGVLALGNDNFACRHCYKLPYASENESPLDRLERAQRKLAKRIFEHEDFRIKKKGMHQKTYDRLLKTYDAIEDSWNLNLLEYCVSRGLVSEAQIFKDHFDCKEKLG